MNRQKLDKLNPKRCYLLRHISYLLSIVLLISSCSHPGSSKRVDLPTDLPQSWVSEVVIEKLPITSSLLDMIENETLRQLVHEGLKHNRDLSATALRLQAANYLLYGSKSRFMPKVNADFSSERNNQSLSVTGDPEEKNRHQLKLGISWEIDLWGRLSAEHAGIESSFRVQQENYLFARDALAARIIESWIEQVFIRRSIEIESGRIEVIKRIETILIDRYKDGIGSLDELSAARSKTEIAKADLHGKQTALNRSIRKLEVLLGRYPKGELLTGSELPIIAPPPNSVRASILLNRPDIRSAMAQVESARHIAEAAGKARYPSLQLSGQVFRHAAQVGSIGNSTTYWGVLGSVFQPLFDGGRLKNEAKAKETEARAELLKFHQVVLTAINEVEDVLQSSKNLNFQTRALKTALQASQKSSHYFEERYRLGLVSISTLLTAKEQEIFIQTRLNELSAGRLKNRIELALALGVGLDHDINDSENEK